MGVEKCFTQGYQFNGDYPLTKLIQASGQYTADICKKLHEEIRSIAESDTSSIIMNERQIREIQSNNCFIKNGVPFLVIINGAGGGDKNTMIDNWRYVNDVSHTLDLSTVDKVYHAFDALISSDTRSEIKAMRQNKESDFRNAMHVIKQLWVDLCDGPTNYVISRYNDLLHDQFYDINTDIHYVTVMCREPEEIEKLTAIFEGSGIPVIRVLIDGLTDSASYTNHADRDVHETDYDIYVTNTPGDEKGFFIASVKVYYYLTLLRLYANELQYETGNDHPV